MVNYKKLNEEEIEITIEHKCIKKKSDLLKFKETYLERIADIDFILNKF